MMTLLTLITFAMPTASAHSTAPVSSTVTQSVMLSNAIQRGVLNTGEINVLQGDIDKIVRAKKNALRDGRITTAEKQKIARLEADFRSDYARLTNNSLRR